MASLLTQISAHVTIDVDSMDPTVASHHTTDSFKFRDMTSNQAIVYTEASKPDRLNILQSACNIAKKASGASLDQQIDDALDILNVNLAKEVYPFITGRVLVQTAPSVAYNTSKTVDHAKKLVSLFEANGIPKSRVCIKIPATPESIIACQQLEQQGISTLATCLFNVPQALAASQAACAYVAPYFNELRVHFEPSIWKEYQETAKEHPMAPVIADIVAAFRGIGSKTLVMPASIVTAKETVALASLKPDHLTLSGSVLQQLADSHEDIQAALAAGPTDVSSSNTDYLANGGNALKDALAADAEATRKLADALKIFNDMEQKTRKLIVEHLQAS
ncbi:aldolase [Abortiporus biennis]|nr:aldolase [Abortiporus biennis]